MTGQGRHGSKTHTACLTCKKRRVKCGLERPSCARCVKAGRTCDGYQLALVKGVSSRTLKETTPPHLTNSSLLLSPFRATQPEWQAYGYYHQRIASALGGAFEAGVWQKLVLQVADTEPAVRQGIFALGNLFRHSQNSVESVSDCLCAHCRRGLQHYGKSLRSFSEYSERTSSQQTVDVALVSCLIYICIEAYRLNDRNAIALISKGCSMITDAMAGAHSKHIAICPTLINLFDRLWLLKSMFGNHTPRPSPEHAHNIASESPSPMQAIATVRDCLHEITTSVQSLRMRVSQTQLYVPSALERADAISTLQMEQQAILSALSLWHSDLQALIDRKGLGSFRQSEAWYILTVQYLITKISASASMDPAERENEDPSEDFQSLVTVAEQGLQKFPPLSEAQIFSFESPFLPALYLTTRKCRNPTIRRKALELMCLTGAKEGLWYRPELMCVAARVIELEEGLAVLDSHDKPELCDRKSLRFYDVWVGLNYRQAGQSFVEVMYLIYDPKHDERWHFPQETLMVPD